MTNEQYVNLEPSHSGYEALRDNAFKPSVNSHQEDIDKIEKYLENELPVNDLTDLDIVEFIEEGLNLLIEKKKKSIETIQRSIDDIDNYLSWHAKGEDNKCTKCGKDWYSD